MRPSSSAPITSSRRHGFSLIEIAMVLAIVAIMLAGVMLFFIQAGNNRKTIETLAEIEQVVSAVHTIYAGNMMYENLQTSVVSKSGLLPSSWVLNGGIVTPYGGSLTVNTYSTASFINIWVNNLPRDACIKIATADLGTASYSRNINWVTDTGQKPFTPTQANSACNNNQKNLLGFNFT